MHAGHLVSGRTNGVLFNERGVFPQCYACNVCRQGMGPEYTVFIIENYGQQVVDDLIQLRRSKIDYSREDYEAMIEGYKKRIIAQGEKP